jgi:hypothetical protein
MIPIPADVEITGIFQLLVTLVMACSYLSTCFLGPRFGV